MQARLFSPVFSLFCLTFIGCQLEQGHPTMVGPEPEPDPRIKYLGKDSLTTGDYRGIAIRLAADDAFEILEAYRKTNTVTYLSAVNNYFSEITDLRNRLHFFDWLVLDETFDTPDGVQIQLNTGKVIRIRLNTGRELNQWPESANTQEAITPGDGSEELFSKLVLLSTKDEYKHKFQRVVLGAKYDYALYNPQKAAQPWSFVYDTRSQGIIEQVRVYFKDKLVDYILVDRFQHY